MSYSPSSSEFLTTSYLKKQSSDQSKPFLRHAPELEVENNRPTESLPIYLREPSHLDSPTFSEELANVDCIETCSQTICLSLAPVLPALFSPPSSENMLSCGQPSFSQAGYDMLGRVKYFFHHSRQYAGLTTAEILHTTYLIDRLVRVEAQQYASGNGCILTEGNLGTLLLVALVLAMKVDRDRPFCNGWWAKLYGVPLDVLNQSELVLLQKLDYHTIMEKGQYETFRDVLETDK